MNLPILIVEFGQQRQRLTLNKFHFNIQELLQLFTELFHIKFDLQNYEILLSNQLINSSTKFNFSEMKKYPRFTIRLCNFPSTICSSADEINLLKQRLNNASMQIIEVTFLINSIHRNCQKLIQTLAEDDQYHSNRILIETNNTITVPPGFKPLSTNPSMSIHNSQSTDEGIDRDNSSMSKFESAYDDYESESIYLECREDVTLINQSTSIINKNNSQLEWRKQSYSSRPNWNNNKSKYSSYYSKDQSKEKPRLKKSINPNKAPLPPEKKKNIPCKYAAGGNCKRGNQCRFIHVV